MTTTKTKTATPQLTPKEFTQTLTIKSVSKILKSTGFKYSKSTALDTLTRVTSLFLRHLANAAARTNDVVSALDDLNSPLDFSLPQLSRFIASSPAPDDPQRNLLYEKEVPLWPYAVDNNTDDCSVLLSTAFPQDALDNNANNNNNDDDDDDKDEYSVLLSRAFPEGAVDNNTNVSMDKDDCSVLLSTALVGNAVDNDVKKNENADVKSGNDDEENEKSKGVYWGELKVVPLGGDGETVRRGAEVPSWLPSFPKISCNGDGEGKSEERLRESCAVPRPVEGKVKVKGSRKRKRGKREIMMFGRRERVKFKLGVKRKAKTGNLDDLEMRNGVCRGGKRICLVKRVGCNTFFDDDDEGE